MNLGNPQSAQNPQQMNGIRPMQPGMQPGMPAPGQMLQNANFWHNQVSQLPRPGQMPMRPGMQGGMPPRPPWMQQAPNGQMPMNGQQGQPNYQVIAQMMGNSSR